MSIGVTPIRPGFVAEITGIDLTSPLPPAVLSALWDASDLHAVLIFRGAPMTDAQQVAFTENFGRPERYALSYRANIQLRLERPEMVDVSNLDAASGRPQTGTTRHRMVNLGNRLWHTDSSFRRPRGGFSLLHAHAVPPVSPLGAGETEFADTCAAFEALSTERQTALEHLRAEHSLMHSRAVLGFTDFAPEERAALPPVVQPLVNTHAVTGRKSLYLASHASHILDMDVADGRLLLMELTELATRFGTTYRHEWRTGDLVMWDNRRTLHRGLPFDERFARDMRRVTTSDGTEPRRDAIHLAG
jgi:alpha-ketoglutarate-dependent 2,4-dichlorophenoxyacetate dioxygenase